MNGRESQTIPGEEQHLQMPLRGKKDGRKAGQRIVGQVELPQRRGRGEEAVGKSIQLIDGQVQLFQLVERAQSAVVQPLHLVTIESENAEVTQWDEAVLCQAGKLIIRRVQRCQWSRTMSRPVEGQAEIGAEIRQSIPADVE